MIFGAMSASFWDPKIIDFWVHFWTPEKDSPETAKTSHQDCPKQGEHHRQKTGGLEGSSGELLEAAWGLKNLFWGALGDVLEAH